MGRDVEGRDRGRGGHWGQEIEAIISRRPRRSLRGVYCSVPPQSRTFSAGLANGVPADMAYEAAVTVPRKLARPPGAASGLSVRRPKFEMKAGLSRPQRARCRVAPSLATTEGELREATERSIPKFAVGGVMERRYGHVVFGPRSMFVNYLCRTAGRVRCIPIACKDRRTLEIAGPSRATRQPYVRRELQGRYLGMHRMHAHMRAHHCACILW